MEFPTLRAVPIPSFADKLASISAFLPMEEFQKLKDEILTLVKTERNYIPAHKKGGTIAYDTLRKTAPLTTALYKSDSYKKIISEIVGVPLLETPHKDNSSLSILFYERPGDHIGWHFDHNFYRGRHFTVLIPIENRGHQPDGLSAAHLLVKQKTEDQLIPTPPNTLIVFEGAKTLHKVTPIQEGERRVILSMTYTTDPRSYWLANLVRKIKDVSFFGWRALWS